jgi:acetyl esterase/lipase
MRHGVLGVQLLLFLWSSLRGSSFVSRSSYFHAARETKLQTSYRASTVLKSSPDVSSSAAEWEDLGGNFVLRPPNDVPVRAVVHFLGGAFVGAAPHVTYRYLLYGLARQGYLVVTTPYRLGFDYLEVCDSILECFERAAVPLAKQYGALPVVGMGHSCGALLQVYITCLFPDTPRAANALISFNNKPVSFLSCILERACPKWCGQYHQWHDFTVRQYPWPNHR